jgi:transcriptional regulator with XRE-family HTH domain
MDKKQLSDQFGNRFRDERIRLGYTQEKLAESLKFRQQTIYKYEKSITFPDVNFLYSLRDLGFDLGYLIFAVPSVTKIQNVPTDVLITISKMVKDLERKFDAGTLSDERRLQISLMYLDHYLQNPASNELASVSTLDLFLSRGA